MSESSEWDMDWCPRTAAACLIPQLPSAIAAAATAAVIKSDLMAAPLAIAVCNVSMAHRRRIRRLAADRPGCPGGKSYEALLPASGVFPGLEHCAARGGARLRARQGQPAHEEGRRRPGLQRGQPQGLRACPYAG